MQVRLIALTAPQIDIEGQSLTAEGLMAYCARVSSPHQESTDYEKLLAYCIAHKHWSIFEMADMTVEIVTSRAISPQILRHKSFQFQEFPKDMRRRSQLSATRRAGRTARTARTRSTTCRRRPWHGSTRLRKGWPRRAWRSTRRRWRRE